MSQKYSTSRLTPSGAKKIMSSFPQDVTAMVPEGFWLINWEPFQPMMSNVDLIMKDSIIFVTMATNGGPLAVSFGTAIPVPIGLRHELDYYCSPGYSNDQELLASHVTRHLTYLHQSYRGERIIFSLIYSQKSSQLGSQMKDTIKTKLNFHSYSKYTDAAIMMMRKMPKSFKEASKL
jgi:hypothetical protein